MRSENRDGGGRSTLLLWAALLLISMWARWPSTGWLFASAACVVVWAVTVRRPIPLLRATAFLFIVALIVAWGGQRQIGIATEDWPALWSRVLDRADQRLRTELDRLTEAGSAAAREASEIDVRARAPSVGALSQVRRRYGLAALAIYDPLGRPLVWDGRHQGQVPREARLGASPFVYGESPLYGYLYFTAPTRMTGRTAVGAVLLYENLPPRLAASSREDFASRFRARHGERIEIVRSDLADGPGVWDFRWEDASLFSVAVAAPAQADRVAELRARWTWLLGTIVLVGTLLLTVAGPEPIRRIGLAGAVIGTAFVFPIWRLAGPAETGGATAVVIPGLPGVTLARLLAVGLAAGFLAGLIPWRRPLLRPLGGAALVALALPTLVGAWLSAPARSLVAGPEISWILLTLSLALVLAAVTAVALDGGRPTAGARSRPLLIALAAALAAGLAAAASAPVLDGVGPSHWIALLWVGPVTVAALGVGGGVSWRDALLRWGLAGWIGGSVALPFAWAARTEARMAQGNEALAELGARPDPYLEFLLTRMGDRMREVQHVSPRPIELLYRSWEQSGLGEEGYPMWLTLWTPDDQARERLPIGVSRAVPPLPQGLLDEARTLTEPAVRRMGALDADYVALIPLDDGWVGTAVVPPRRTLLSTSPLGPLFATVRGLAPSPLRLVPYPPGDSPTGAGELTWTRTGEGLVAERPVRYPDGPYRALFRLDLPPPLVAVARGALLLLMASIAFLLVAGLGEALEVGSRPGAPRGLRSVRSFRARVTLALFAFFLIPTVGVGLYASRALEDAAVRTATALAERAAQEAASGYAGTETLATLARQVGSDLVVYDAGDLEGGAVHELVELGIYPGWVPHEVHRQITEGDALTSSGQHRLGNWEYVMAYWRLNATEVIGSLAAVEEGATALGRREALDLLLFGVVLGAGLSLALALMVGRAFARPIRTLQVASERVGSGNLLVHLPESRSDEFGSVFRAFNRMVERLGQTREDLVRTTRRTEAIVEEAATGVIALDPDGRVVLVNPRAESLLRADVPPGTDAYAKHAGALGEFFAWVRTYFEDGGAEASTEFQLDERRIRARGRRISRSEPFGGAVFSLEDVTDALRAERVLAWGEMARQVAHEVKNPLTPIKLSVQHIRRAWTDRHPEFDQILTDNVGAVLGEIDRLADIAGSFSRFSAPGDAADTPLVAVVVPQVVDEVLSLYQGGDTGRRFESEVPSELPPVRARRDELKEVLVNLLENAREATSDGAPIRVSAQHADGVVELSIIDTGTGIPEDLMARLFEPHFSTRSSGTGLGLAIVRRLVKSWGGAVSIRSREGEGTEVRVEVPTWVDATGTPDTEPST